MKGILATVPVWGERYVRRWLEFSLPSLLADGNLPALARAYPLRFLIATTRADEPQILAAPAVAALRDLGDVRVSLVGDHPSAFTAERKHFVMIDAHNAALAAAWQDDCGVLFLLGDSLYADGSFRHVADRIAAGKRACLTQGVSVVEDRLRDRLQAAAAWRGPALAVPPRELVRHAVAALHPWSAAQRWDAARFTSFPAMMYWPLGGHGFLMRCWHLYPVFLYPERAAQGTTPIDDDIVVRALGGLEACAVMDDSDGCFFVDVGDADSRSYADLPMGANTLFVATWASVWAARPHHRAQVRHKFWFHDGIARDDWRAAAAASDRAVDEILAAAATVEAMDPAQRRAITAAFENIRANADLLAATGFRPAAADGPPRRTG